MTADKKGVAILGATGMLGSMVYNVLKKKHRLILVIRDKKKLPLLEEVYGSTTRHRVTTFDFVRIYQDYLKGFKNLPSSPNFKILLDKVGEVETIINCVGAIPQIPHAFKKPGQSFFINSALPHLLSSTFKEKMIHITTDGVFNGLDGFPYHENSPHTPTDLYGLTKSIGEPNDCLTLRTSLVGPEITGFFGLLEWFRKQTNKTVRGFQQNIWNGITTKQFAKICDAIIQNRKKFPKNGIFHVFSTPISKYEMLLKFKEKYGIDCDITPDNSTRLNRTLTTIHQLNSQLKIPSFDEMLKEL